MVERDDTFHKMSKKIAQLTKVIFHLNTKNDEADLHLRSVSNAYEQEIEGIVRNCNAKIQDAWNAFEKVKNETAVREQSRGMKEKLESEKQNMLKEIEDLKLHQVKKEQESFRHWTDRVTTLTEELDELRVRCREQRESFDRSLQQKVDQHSQALLDQKATLSGTLEAESTKWDEERVLLNAKIRSLEGARSDAENDWKRKVEERDENSANLASQLAEKQKSLEKAIADKTALESELEDTETRRKQTAEDRDRVVEDLSRLREGSSATASRLESERAELLKMKTELGSQVAKLQASLDEETTKAADREREFSRYKSEASMSSREAQDTVERLRDSFALEKKRWEETKKSLEDGKEAVEKKFSETEKRRAELDTRAQRLEEQANTLTSERDSSRAERDKLQSEIDALRKQIEETSSGAKTDIDILRQKHTAEIEELEKKLKEKQAAHKQELDATIEKHKAEIASLQASLSADFASKTEAASEKYTKEKEELTKAHNERIEELQRSFITDRDRDRHETSAAREKEHADFEQKVATLQGRLEEEESKRRNLEDLGGDTAKQLHAVRETLAAKEAEAAGLGEQLKTARDRVQNLESKNLSSDERHAATIARMREDLSRETEECRVAKQDNTNLQKDLTLVRNEKQELERNLVMKDESIDSLEKQLQDKERGLGEVSTEAKQKMDLMTAQMNRQLNDAKDDAVKMVQELTQQHQQKIADIYEKHGAELERVKQRHNIELTEKIAALEDQHTASLQQLKSRHDGELAQLDGNLRMEMEKLRQQHEAETQAARERHKELADEKRATDAKCAALEKDLRCSSSKIDELTSDIAILRADLVASEKRIEDLMQSGDESLRRLKADADKREAQIRASFESEKQNLEANHQDEVARMNQIRADIEAEGEQLRARILELQQMFENRPSRPEDVEQIRLLHQECRDRETAFNQLRDEMQYYRLELVNREQNYNKVFGVSGPNVGVLNPVSAHQPTQPNSRKSSGAQQPSTRPGKTGGVSHAVIGGGQLDAGGLPPLGVAVGAVGPAQQAATRKKGGKRPISGGERRPTLESVNDNQLLLYK
ncbi:unnamed protein product [Amoebophrya sp. A120]|nr:unnamed protein product [Amoebophrya sp. A120]|eukprot:GSA120T00003719001.1